MTEEHKRWCNEVLKEQCRCGYIYNGKEFDDRFCPNCGANRKEFGVVHP